MRASVLDCPGRTSRAQEEIMKPTILLSIEGLSLLTVVVQRGLKNQSRQHEMRFHFFG
ncbi:MAG: hypothetical protein QOJ42_1250 [Acidobacteriaceae bacterium]|jgi:hypothetical protein|nr:hypothetical protein [Acidobacteriaceae bacterium]MDX6459871.1 hypothetical protein [Acidobacteriaceae bacterium]